jgi:hypothetical protein
MSKSRKLQAITQTMDVEDMDNLKYFTASTAVASLPCGKYRIIRTVREEISSTPKTIVDMIIKA